MPCHKPLALLLTLLAASARAQSAATSPTATATPEAAQRDAPAPTPVPEQTAATPAPVAPVQSSAPPAASPSSIPAQTSIQPVPAPPAVRPEAGAARVRVAVNFSNASLETRPFGGAESWQRLCLAPCGDWLAVEGAELRVTAPGMTPSGPFRVDPGALGPALLKVDGGSSLARSLGRIGLVVGVPVALLGMTGFAYGHFDERRGLETAGAISLGVGAAMVLTALPLLVIGGTSVRNEKGDLIARDAPNGARF